MNFNEQKVFNWIRSSLKSRTKKKFKKNRLIFEWNSVWERWTTTNLPIVVAV